jgi:hypothetical protein
MCYTIGGDEVGQARAEQAQWVASRALIVVVPGLSWQECFLKPHGGDTDSKRSVAWTFLVGWPCVGRPVGHLSIPASVSAKAPNPLPYKRSDTLHSEN